MSQDIKNLMGIKQEHLAMILGVNRSQLSMYLIGKRDLPLEAKLQLSQILVFFNKSKKTKKIENDVIKNDAIKANQLIEAQIKENAYKQIIIEKKLKIKEKKFIDAQKTLQIIEFLVASNLEIDSKTKSIYEMIKNNAEHEIQTNGLAAQMPLKFLLHDFKHQQMSIENQFSKYFSKK